MHGFYSANLLMVLALGTGEPVEPGDGPIPPLSPAEALEAFALNDEALTIEVAVAEPDVVDPIDMAFDADGRLYVVEMRGFQLGPEGKGIRDLCRIRRFEDRTGDGYFEHNTIFVDELFYPSAVMPVSGGVLVGLAPDLVLFRDTTGDGRADQREVLYTGFDTSNHEQLLNSFRWGLDNWIHGSGAGRGGEVRPADAPEAAPVSLRNRNFRLRLGNDDHPGRFEATSGGGQYGLTFGDGGRWFTCHNARHIIEIVFPDHYLRGNRYLAPPRVIHDISDHGAAARIYRISPFEEWRVVRTRQRAEGPQASRFPASELVPGGYVTAACGITIYHGDALPGAYYGDSFVADAANNLIHRDRLEPDGVRLIARRTDEEVEFLASTDPWFRPTALANGPDGALYVVDMYREIIETPESIPPDILRTIDMEAGKDRGRIYRIRPRDWERPAAPALSQASAEALVPLLGHPNGWYRLTAQRLLVERRDRSVVEALRAMVRDGGDERGRLHALCTLEGLDAADRETLLNALHDPSAMVRIHALRVAEPLLEADGADSLAEAVVRLVDDPEPRVRFQLGFTLRYVNPEQGVPALARIAAGDAQEAWMRVALLSSVEQTAGALWEALHADGLALFSRQSEAGVAMARELMSIIAARGDREELADALEIVVSRSDASHRWWRAAAIAGCDQGMRQSGMGTRLFDGDGDPPRAATLVLALVEDDAAGVRRASRQLAGRIRWRPFDAWHASIERHLDIALDEDQPAEERVSASEFAARGPVGVVLEPLLDLLAAHEPPEVQEAVVQAIARTGSREAVAGLLARERWASYTPALRDVVIEAVLGRTAYVPALLDAIEHDDVPAGAIDDARRQVLLEHQDDAIRERAERLLTMHTDAERQAVYEHYLQAMELPGDAERGREVYRENCAACHVLDGMGTAVGPDLATARGKEPAALLMDVLIPSRAITAGYTYYIVETVDGETLTGLIASESSSAITLHEREGVERTVLRSNIYELRASRLSMMPQDLENNIDPKQMADLITFLNAGG